MTRGEKIILFLLTLVIAVFIGMLVNKMVDRIEKKLNQVQEQIK